MIKMDKVGATGVNSSTNKIYIHLNLCPIMLHIFASDSGVIYELVCDLDSTALCKMLEKGGLKNIDGLFL